MEVVFEYEGIFVVAIGDMSFIVEFVMFDSSEVSVDNIAKPRPMKNVISLSLVLDLANNNVYPKVYQNTPLSSRKGYFHIFRI